MRILHVTPSFAPAWSYGGPIYTVLHLCEALVRAGCDVRVLTTDADGPRKVLNVDKKREVQFSERLRVRYCRRSMPDAVSIPLLRLLPRYVRWADVVHLTAIYSFPTIPTLMAAKISNKPLVWSPRGSLQRWEGSTRPQVKAVWERICRAAAPDKLILHATSLEEAEESRSHFPSAATNVIANGVDIPTVNRSKRPGEALRVLYLGRLHPKKGIDNLLAACKLLESRGVRFTLTIAGSGDESYETTLKLEIDRLGLSDSVKMIGAVEGEAKRATFENADLVVVPSYTENFGMIVAEALAHAVPVVASKGTPWQRLEEIGCGLWVENDRETLADAITRISRLPLEEMGQKGRRWMVDEFSWDRIASEMLDCYRSLAPGDVPGYERRTIGPERLDV